ncbi:M24 family metallopeptidase [Mesorhizobium sp. B4-1-4]|uniref:M24 family metallopeptidase n=1 Tax=Mesorhizobium sp. B4-1-4 TaxID=2589888 RepID=UPI00112A6B4A|nr:Xaa-Pro peptidase family protein [Mesorhizobium sp. B4-1-4]UCI31886.1 Xaa-Pro peptidase family protein [Mesorhizobium sp. B4-1-4]
MDQTFSVIPLAGVPFPRAEYERRQQEVLGVVAGAGLDALLVTALGHARYLTGYYGGGSYFGPFPLILAPGHAPTYIVREYEVESVRAYSCINEIVSYTQERDFAKVCGDVLRRYGLENKRIGLELRCWNLTPSDVYKLEAELPEMTVVDATELVGSVAAVKSELELDAMRNAMAMTEVAVRSFQETLRNGVTESETWAAMQGAVKKTGGEELRLVSLVFGERTKLAHGLPSDHAINSNEPAVTEIGGVKFGYAAGLVRTAVVGRHPEAETLLALSNEALDTAIDVIKPGVTAEEVDATVRKVIERSGRPRAFRNKAGYQTGINWSERGNMDMVPGVKDVLKAGMTLHMPIMLFGEKGHIIGCSDHILVTERGAESLSGAPRTLYRV